jgi:hypothetical protein
VVAHLLQDPTSLELLSSVQHVLVVMETIGQAFGLDVDDNSVIMQCAELYRRWLLTDAKPAAFMLNEQDFYVVRITSALYFSLSLGKYARPSVVRIFLHFCLSSLPNRWAHLFVVRLLGYF